MMKRHWETGVPEPTTLSNWNFNRSAEQLERKLQFNNPERFENGLLCNECLGVLYDTNQQEAGHPVRLIVKCKSCGKKDWRYE